MRFSPDGEYFLSVFTNRVRVVPIHSTNAPSLRLGGQPSDPLYDHASFSPDGRKVVAAASDEHAYVWNVVSNVLRLRLKGHREDLVFTEFSPDGGRIVTTSTDNTARVWDATTGREACPPLIHKGWVTFAQFSADGLKLLTVSSDRKVRVWDVLTGESLCESIICRNPVASAEFSPDSRRVVIAAGENHAQVWDILPGRAHPEVNREIAGHVDWTGKYDANEHTIYGFAAPLWRINKLGPTSLIVRVLGHDLASAQAHWSPRGSWLVAHLTNGSCRIHEYSSGTPLTAPLARSGPVMNISFSPDRKWCVTVATNQVARLWDARTGRLVHEHFVHNSSFLDPLFSPDGRRLLLAAGDSTLGFWDVASGHQLGTNFWQVANGLTCAEFSSDGRRLVTAAHIGNAVLRDGETGVPLAAPLQHDQAVICARFSPDGETVVTASEDQSARLWNAHTGAALTDPLRHTSRVVWAAFSHDGRQIATFGQDGSARRWEVRSGRSLGHPLRVGRAPVLGEFTLDDRRLIVHLRPRITDSGQLLVIQTWPVPVSAVTVAPWFADFAEAAGGLRLNDQGHAVRLTARDYFDRRNELTRPDLDDANSAWARWFIADRSKRANFPGSRRLVSDQLGSVDIELKAELVLDAAREAAQLDPLDGRAFAQLSLALTALAQSKQIEPGSQALAAHLGKRAVALAPKDSKAWMAHVMAAGTARGPTAALAAIEAGLKELPTDPILLEGRAAQLRNLARKEEAIAAYTEALNVTERDPGAHSGLRQRMFQNRADLLEQLGRTEEARADRVKAGNPTAAPRKEK